MNGYRIALRLSEDPNAVFIRTVPNHNQTASKGQPTPKPANLHPLLVDPTPLPGSLFCSKGLLVRLPVGRG